MSADGGVLEPPRGRGSSLPPDAPMVGGSLTTGRTPPATPKKVGGKMLAVKVLMLDDTYTLFQIQSKALGVVLLEQTCRQLNLLESDYFALEYTDGNTRYWLDLDKAMNRQVCLSQVEPVLRFCVKFYTPDPAQLEEEFTRYLFALQIKRDLSHGELCCNENTAALLSSYIVQAECGDYAAEDYPDHRYLSLFKFIPTQDSTVERKIMENHKKHIGMSPAAADLNLLETARRCELFGIKMHPGKDHENVVLNLAVAHMGILVFQSCTKINTFSWAKIRKLSFKRKKFLIKLHPEGYDAVEFFFDGRNECKNFWKKCVEHHGFFRCSAVKKMTRQKTRVISRGSSFRYSGRTQKQVQDFVRDSIITRQPFQRSQSFRQSPMYACAGNSGSSVSGHPLTPLGNNQCVGTPASLSCGSMTLTSTADMQSPGSPARPNNQEYDPRELETPLDQGTLSPDGSVPSSSPHRNNYHSGQHSIPRSHRLHFQRIPSVDTSSTTSSRLHGTSRASLLEDAHLKEFSNYLDDRFAREAPAEDSGDNLSHDSYELLEREIEEELNWKGSGSVASIAVTPSNGHRTSQLRPCSMLLSSTELLNSGELGWCESKGGGDMVRGSGRTGSLPRSLGSSNSKLCAARANGCTPTGSLPRTPSVSQCSDLSRSLAGSRASSRITLEIALEARPELSEDELSSAGSPEFHENSVCEITSEKGYLLAARHLGSITIGGEPAASSCSRQHSLLSRGNSLTDMLAGGTAQQQRSRSNSHTHVSHDNLKADPADTSASLCTMSSSSRLSVNARAAKQIGHYVDYGSSQESIHKASSCESDVGSSSVSSQTRSSTTPRPASDFHSVKFLPRRRRSTSTSPPSITSGSSHPTPVPPMPVRPHSMDFSLFRKKAAALHHGGYCRGSDSGGNTDSDICSPLEIPLPLMSQPEKVLEVDEEDLTPSQEQVLFLTKPPDLDLITVIRGSSDEEEEFNKPAPPPPPVMAAPLVPEIDHLMDITRCVESSEEYNEQLEKNLLEELMEMSPKYYRENDEFYVSVDDKASPFLYDFQSMVPLQQKDGSPSSEMEYSVTDTTTTSRERRIDESDASDKTVIDRFRLPDDRLVKMGSRDSQEEIDEEILDRRSSVSLDRRTSQESARRQSYQEADYYPPQSPRDRRPSSYDGGDRRSSPYFEPDRRSLTLDTDRRSPFDVRERKLSSSSSRRSSASSDHRSSVSSDRRGSSSSDHRPSLSDIGRRTSVSYEPGQRSPFFDAPVFEFESPKGGSGKPLSPFTSGSDKSPVLERDNKILYFDGIVLDSGDEFTEALIPADDTPESLSPSGARVVEIVEGVFEPLIAFKKKDIEVINIEQDDEYLEVEILRKKQKFSPKAKPRTLLKPELETLKVRTASYRSDENLNTDLSDEVFVAPGKQSSLIDLSVEVVLGPKERAFASPLPPEERLGDHLKREDLLGAVGGSSAEEEGDFYDDEDDHAQMSDQSPELSEPDEYPDEYQEPEYFQQFSRQIDVGFAFPSRTLSRISERSTTSEQEHEQDHVVEQSDSKGSTPTEEQRCQSDSSDDSDESGSSDDTQQADKTAELCDNTVEGAALVDNCAAAQQQQGGLDNAAPLSVEEQKNVSKFATQLFLHDLPDFVGDGSDDEFPSPPSSAFLENPHAELSFIETYYVEMNERAAQQQSAQQHAHTAGDGDEGIYDNIPAKFQDIHEISESESASEDHTLRGTSVGGGGGDEDRTPTGQSPSPPPPPPPRTLPRQVSMATPSPPLTPPTPLASLLHSPADDDACSNGRRAPMERITENEPAARKDNVIWINI